MSNSKSLKIRRCIVCSNTNRTATDVSYFRIPLDQDYAEKWFINLRRTDLLDDLSLHTSSFICSDHFPPDRMFLCKANDQYLKRLKRGALPYKITEDGQVEDPTSEKSDDDNDESFDCSIADMIRQKMYTADDTGGLDTTTNGYADNETSTNDVDEDFNLDLFDDVDPKEIEQYKTHFPKLEKIADSKTHCTSCQYHIGTAPINEAFIKMHPILRVTQCKKCFTFYNSGEFERGEDGSELYCRWCGQGGEVYCCSNCPYVFCRRCIVQNLSRNMVTEIQNNENWSCFACAPQCMIPLRASHWALVNFIEKQKREITNRSVDEIEMNDLMSNDISRCCSSSKKRSLKRKVENTAVITPPPEKRKSYAPSPKLVNVTRKSAENKTAAEDDDSVAVQCTPDILSLFNNEEQTSSPNNQAAEAPPLRLIRREVTIRPNNSGATRPSLPTPPQPTPPPPQPTPPPQQPVVAPSPPIQTASPLPVQMTPTTSNPVYHTINGFRIDLNTAAQQETYRLPNGKLIQVKKQTPNVTQSGPTPPERTPPVVSRPPPVVARPPPVVTRPSILPTRPPSLPSTRSYVSVRTPVGPPVRPARPQQFQVQHRQPIQIQTRLVGNNQMRLMNGPIIQQLPPPSSTTQQTNNPNNPPPLVFRTGHGNSPVGKARTQFEERVDNSMEVCQHIIGKINTLTSSSSYKKVRSLMDLKDLTIHLSYLLTYAIGRFKTLQEKCIEDMKAMGFDPDKPADPASDDDDIVIVEPKTTTINLDSDDEEEDVPTVPTNITEHTNNIEQVKSVSNGDHNIEDGAPSQPQQNHLGNESTTNDIANNNEEVDKQQNTDNAENASGELVDKEVPMDVSDSTGTFTEKLVHYDDDVVQVVEEVNENDATENLAQTEDYNKLPEVAKDKPFEEINEKEPARENDSEKISEPTTQELVKDNVEAVEKVKEINVQTEPEAMEISLEIDEIGATDKSVEDNMPEDNSEMIETRKETGKYKVSEEREETAVEITSENLADEADKLMQEDIAEPGDQTTPQIPATAEVEGIPEETSENVSALESKASEENSEIETPVEENATEIVPEAEASDKSENGSLGNNLDDSVSNVSKENTDILFPMEKHIDASPSSIKENIVEEDLPEETNNIDAKIRLSEEILVDVNITSIKENIVQDDLPEEINNIEAKTPLSEEKLIDVHLSSIKENIVDDDLSEEINNIDAKTPLSEEKLIGANLSSIKENVKDDLPEEINTIDAKTPLSEGNEAFVIQELSRENIVGPVPEVTEEKSGDAILDKSIEAIVEQNSTIADEISEFLDNNSDDTVLANTEIPEVPEEENITNPISNILCDKITDNICIPDEIDDSMCESTTAGDNLSLLDDIGDSLCESTTAGNEDMDCNDKLTDNICLPDDIADSMLESAAPGEDRDPSTLLDDIIMKTLELDASV